MVNKVSHCSSAAGNRYVKKSPPLGPLAFVQKKIIEFSKTELQVAQPSSVQILKEEPCHPVASRVLNFDSTHSHCILEDPSSKHDHRHLYEWRGSHPRDGG